MTLAEIERRMREIDVERRELKIEHDRIMLEIQGQTDAFKHLREAIDRGVAEKEDTWVSDGSSRRSPRYLKL